MFVELVFTVLVIAVLVWINYWFNKIKFTSPVNLSLGGRLLRVLLIGMSHGDSTFSPKWNPYDPSTPEHYAHGPHERDRHA